MPSACERRSLLTGISHGEPSRREIRSENHTRPGQNGATSNRRTPSQHTLSRTPGSRAIGGKSYRRSLGQVCTIASSPNGAGWVRENQRGQCDVWRVANKTTWAWPKLSISASPTRGEASISRASAPASTGCLLPYWDAQEYELLSAREACPETTQGSGAPACIRGANVDLPGGLCKRPPLCCRCSPTHGDLLGLEESVWVLETRPASPGSWCATWDGDHSTDRGQGGHSWPLPNRWGTRLSLALRGDKELPAPGPETRTKVSSTCLRHIGIAAWSWSCEAGFPSGRTPWSWATTVGVSCTAGQKISRWTQLPSDPAVSGTAWQWVTGLLSLSWLPWGSTRSEQGTYVPASWSNPTPRPDKWFSVLEKAHFSGVKS